MTNNDADQLYDWPTVIQLIQMYGGIQTYRGIQMYWRVYRCMEEHTDLVGVQTYEGIQMYEGCADIWGCMDLGGIWCMGVYRHMGAYGCTCLPTTPEGICKKFPFPLIISHVHHLSTEMEGKILQKCLNVYL